MPREEKDSEFWEDSEAFFGLANVLFRQSRLSKTEFASVMKVDVDTLGSILVGKHHPRYETLLRFVEVAKASYEDRVELFRCAKYRYPVGKPPVMVEGVLRSFSDLDELLVHNGQLDFLVVTGHNERFEQGIPSIVRDAQIRGGNFSDLFYLPALFAYFTSKAALVSKQEDVNQPPPHHLWSHIVPDVYLEKSQVEKRNLIALGGPNVNWLTRFLFQEYWDDTSALPLRFRSQHGRPDAIHSALTRADYAQDPPTDPMEDYGILEVVPSPFAKDKVVILCCGIEFWGTQAATLALCCDELRSPGEGPGRRGRAATVVKVQLECKALEGIDGISVGRYKELKPQSWELWE